jgi:PPOX class probable F420-dependent enzyme
VGELTDDALWAVVAQSQHGVLATIGPTGLPQLSNVYYVPDPAERAIRISTTTTRAKGRNLGRDPRCALHVAGSDFFNFVVADCDARLAVAASPGDPATDELYAIQAVFNGDKDRPAFDEAVIAEHRVAVTLTVGRLYGLIHSSAT